MDNEALRKIFKSKRHQINTKNGKTIPGFKNVQFDEFMQWFHRSNFHNGCYYCGITNQQSAKLAEMRSGSTRGGRRGKRLELDRIDPNLPYDQLNNVVWCCYWCNNAKSNFFSGDEFRPIAVEMKKVLNNILET